MSFFIDGIYRHLICGAYIMWQNLEHHFSVVFVSMPLKDFGVLRGCDLYGLCRVHCCLLAVIAFSVADVVPLTIPIIHDCQMAGFFRSMGIRPDVLVSLIRGWVFFFCFPVVDAPTDSSVQFSVGDINGGVLDIGKWFMEHATIIY